MILSFKKQFITPILAGRKIHTVREDVHNRYHPGMAIYFTTGVRTKKYKEFWPKAICNSVQNIFIDPDEYEITILDNGVTIPLSGFHYRYFALNEGFDNSVDFWHWFDKPFRGKIINWTPFRYR